MNNSKLFEQISHYYSEPSMTLRSDFAQLSKGNFDLGYRTDYKNGQEKHMVTRTITISAQKTENGKYTNLLFSNGQPIRLELADSTFRPFINDYVEIRYIFSGSQTITFEEETLSLKENDICLFSSMYMRQEHLDTDCLFLNISIDPAFFNESILTEISLNPLQTFLRAQLMNRQQEKAFLLFEPESRHADEDINHYLRNIFREAKGELPGYLEITKGFLIRLMDELTNNYRSVIIGSDIAVYRKKLFQAVSVYISEHISSVSISDLSKVFHYHANYINLLIKEFTGLTYSSYLIYLRMERARLLLETTSLSIEEIMFLLGYNNKGFFYRKFTEYTGMKPAAYRRTLRKEYSVE